MADGATDGLRKTEVAALLDLQSAYEGLSRDYLTRSVLGLLLNEGAFRKVNRRDVITAGAAAQ